MTLLNLSSPHPLGASVGTDAISYRFGRAALGRTAASPACLELACLHGHLVASLQLEAFETIGWAQAESLGEALRYVTEESPVRRRYERLPAAPDEPVIFRTTDARLKGISPRIALRLDDVVLNVVHDEALYRDDLARDDAAIFGALAHAVRDGRFVNTPLREEAIPQFSARGAMRLLLRVLLGANRATLAEPYLEPGRRLVLDYVAAHGGGAPLPTFDDLGDVELFLDRFFNGDDAAMGLPSSVRVDDAQALSAANELAGAVVHHRAARGDVEGAVDLAQAMLGYLRRFAGEGRAAALASRLERTYTQYLEFGRGHQAV